MRNDKYVIQDNITYYKQYHDIYSVDDKIIAVLITNILCKDYLGSSINHRVRDVYHADVDATVREHLFTFNISEALGVEFKEVTDE